MRALLLPVADELYAVELSSLRTVVGAPRLFTVPTAPPSLLGLLNLRGEMVPVLDTGLLLHMGPLVAEGSAQQVGFAAVVDHPHGAVALAAVGQPRTVVLGDKVAAGEVPGTLGTYRAEGSVATLLDIHTFLLPAAM